MAIFVSKKHCTKRIQNGLKQKHGLTLPARFSSRSVKCITFLYKWPSIKTVLYNLF
ncbi:Uncharacterized protein APZ42_027585 [Daphnia magna]|uniref:Uncharacterized protein n=1 Tax=Daphnia magna TaxID=35525 RepID=A0A0P5Y176_9CRUS|nr:Uncharacterized protein APZ42_027585 [Daphnia magna]